MVRTILLVAIRGVLRSRRGDSIILLRIVGYLLGLWRREVLCLLVVGCLRRGLHWRRLLLGTVREAHLPPLPLPLPGLTLLLVRRVHTLDPFRHSCHIVGLKTDRAASAQEGMFVF
jgi:hypothetical protein